MKNTSRELKTAKYLLELNRIHCEVLKKENDDLKKKILRLKKTQITLIRGLK